jgi:hypothetical protein
MAATRGNYSAGGRVVARIARRHWPMRSPTRPLLIKLSQPRLAGSMQKLGIRVRQANYACSRAAVTQNSLFASMERHFGRCF